MFKDWMENQDWEGNQLDKDLLFEGNKVYGPKTCVFVTRMVNNFTLDSGAARENYRLECTGIRKRTSLCRRVATHSRRNENTLATSQPNKKLTKHG